MQGDYITNSKCLHNSNIFGNFINLCNQRQLSFFILSSFFILYLISNLNFKVNWESFNVTKTDGNFCWLCNSQQKLWFWRYFINFFLKWKVIFLPFFVLNTIWSFLSWDSFHQLSFFNKFLWNWMQMVIT